MISAEGYEGGQGPPVAGLTHSPRAGADSFTVPLKSCCHIPVLSLLLSPCITPACAQGPGEYSSGALQGQHHLLGEHFLHTILLPAEVRRRSHQLTSSIFEGLTPWTPLPDNTPHPRFHEQSNMELFAALHLSSRISTGRNLLLIKATALKLQTVSFLFCFNKTGFRATSMIKILSPMLSAAFSL